MVGAEFLDKVLYYKKSWLPARELVEEAVKRRKEVTITVNYSKITLTVISQGRKEVTFTMNYSKITLTVISQGRREVTIHSSNMSIIQKLLTNQIAADEIIIVMTPYWSTH